MALKSVYDDKFEENVSVVQKTGFWKTSFVQRLAVSNIFGGLEKKKKKKKKNGYHRKRFLNAKKVQVQSCFSFQVNFHYPNNVDDLENLIDQFKKKKKTEKVLLMMMILS